ncbi:Trans-enoyl reductase ACTTS2 [Paramyrothecium foliicola]|nr:Trans-enoyl reductase ACTTS2 [Paramyrothecium foliicola]
MKVIKIQPGGFATVVEAPLPKLHPGCVIIKTTAVSLNPVDWKHISLVPGTAGCTAGSDFAGLVRKVGSKVTTLKPGDRVAGWTHGGNINNKEDGSFADYVVAKADFIFKIPVDMNFSEAATLGLGMSTVGLGLYRALQLPLPTRSESKHMPLLVYGGSTATGTLAIQSGLKVIATCSAHNFGMIRSLGADEVFDYRDENVGNKIRELTQNGLYHAFDCISTDESARICAEALSNKADAQPMYSAILYCKLPREDVQVKVTIAFTIFGESFTKPELGPVNFPASMDDYNFGKEFWRMSERLLAEKKLIPHPLDVRNGGLDSVLEGIDDLREEPKNLGSCGATAAEARNKGCVFDFILGAWIHKECLDEEMYETYLDKLRTLNITFFSGPDEKDRVGEEYALAGDYDLIWAIGNFHYLHCSYVTAKTLKAFLRERKAVPSNSMEDEHMEHCLNITGRPSVQDITNPTIRQIFERPPILDCLVYH